MPTPAPRRRVGGSASPLSNWPRYPGGVIAGALIAAASVLMFFIDNPALRHFLRAAGIVVLALWVWRLCRSDD